MHKFVSAAAKPKAAGRLSRRTDNLLYREAVTHQSRGSRSSVAQFAHLRETNNPFSLTLKGLDNRKPERLLPDPSVWEEACRRVVTISGGEEVDEGY